MTIAVLANQQEREEWENRGIKEGVEVLWADTMRAFTSIEADAYFDLLFSAEPERMKQLDKLKNRLVFINAVTMTLQEAGNHLVRLNAWPGFLNRPVTELCIGADVEPAGVETVFNALGWEYQQVPDVPGMISMRVIAMIINEAYYTLGDGVSSREEIDIAMKLGTNYPMGPFEWGDFIGLEAIYGLLQKLAQTDLRYKPAPALEKAVLGYRTYTY